MEPITTELRRSMSERSDAFTGVSVLYCEKDRFVQLCDAIDAVHARLEQENDELNATLGQGTCHEVMIDRFFRGCGECGYMWEYMYSIGKRVRPNFCPNCGRRIEVTDG